VKTVFKTTGTCAQEIHFEIEDGIIQSVEFVRGCPGGGKGVSALAVGRKPEEVIGAIKGILCGDKGTSCPDQLASALSEHLAKA